LFVFIVHDSLADPAFVNSNFEDGTFKNWSVHKNWSIVNPGSMPGIPATDKKIDILGQWGASSIYRLGEKTIARYSGTSSHGFPRRLESIPFKAKKRFLVFSLWQAKGLAPGVKKIAKPEICIGVDTNEDGKPDITLTDKELSGLKKGVIHRFSLDLEKVKGKKVRFIAETYCVLISLDNLMLEDFPSVYTKIAGISDKNGIGTVKLKFSNPHRFKSIVKGNIQIIDYFNNKIADIPFEQKLNSKQTLDAEYHFPVKNSPQYRVTVNTYFQDKIPESQLYIRHFTDEIRQGRPKLKINHGWQITTSMDKKPELPGINAKWTEESPCKPSGAYQYRDIRSWNKHQKTTQIWYRKIFTVPEWLKGEQLILSIPNGGAGLMTVFLNGKKIREHTLFNFTKNTYNLTSLLKTKGDNELILRFRNPKIYFMDSDGRWLEPIREYHGIPRGIYGNIYLEKCPDVYVEQMFIDPSLSMKKLDVRIRLDNCSNKSRKVTIKQSVVDASGKTVLTFPPKKATIKPNGKTLVKMSTPWQNPILWTPDTPNLLKLNCQVDNGSHIDEVNERFGFREFSIKDNLYLLNGYPISITDTLSQEPEIMGAWKQWWGANAVRSPWISLVMADHGDEDGFFMRSIFEYYYLGGGKPRQSFPKRHIKSFQDLQLKTVEYFYNHPCVYMWCLGNELDGHGYFQAAVKDFYTSVFKPIVEKVNEIDHQRPCVSSGDAIMPFWRKQVWSVHYPHEYGITHDLPNEAHLIKNKKPLHVLAMKLPYDGKPVFCGENFTEGGIGPYLTNIAGDKQMDFDTMFDAWKEYFQIRLRAYREDRISASAPFSPIATIRNYYPIDVYPQDYNEQFYSGEVVNQNIMILNDTFSHQDLILHYLLEGGKEGSVKVKCSPGDRKAVPIELHLPVVEKRKDLQFSLWLTDKNGKRFQRWGQWQGKYAVFPKIQIQGKIAVWQGNENVEKMLKFFGFSVRKVNSVKELTDIKLVLLDNECLKHALSSGLGKWVEQGGTAMLLLKEGDYGQLPVPLIATGHRDTRAFNIAPGHQLLKGIRERDLYFWNKDDFRICYSSFSKPESGNCQILVVNGDKDGLRFSPYLVERNGKGNYLISTLLLDKCYQRVPIIGLILKNAFKFANSKEKAVIHAGALVSDQVQELFKDNNLAIDDLAQQKEVKLENYDLIIIDANLADPDVNELDSFVENGGTLILNRLTPENLPRYKKLIGSSVKLSPAPKEGNEAGMMVKTGNDFLLDCVSNNDLLWKRGQVMLIASQPKDMRIVTSHPADYTLKLETGNNAQTLLKPALLAKIAKGKGEIIFDQIRWSNAIEEEPRSNRILTTILANLGVSLVSRDANRECKNIVQNLALPMNYNFKKGVMEAENNVLSFFRQADITYKNLHFPLVQGENKAILLGTGKNARSYQKQVILSVDTKADRLFFLHSSAFGYIDWSANKPVIEYTVKYDNGKKEVINAVYGQSLDDYRVESAAPLSTGKQVSVAEDKGLSTYVMPWKNPHPESQIKEIVIRSVDDTIVPLIIGILAEKKNPRSNVVDDRRRKGLWSIRKDVPKSNTEGRIWAIAGPFPHTSVEPYSVPQQAFKTQFGPEKRIDFKQLFRESTGTFTWRKFIQKFPEQHPSGTDFMRLDDIIRFGPKANMNSYVSYLFTKVYSDREQKILIAFGSDDSGKIWINGKLVHSKWALRGTRLGDDMVETTLKKGWNTVLIKHLKMRLGAGIAFDIKPYSEKNKSLYNEEHAEHKKFAEIPSLPLRYDAYAAVKVRVPSPMTLEENGKKKSLSGEFTGSGVKCLRIKQGPFKDKMAFNVDFTAAGRQAMTANYNNWYDVSGTFDEGIFKMDFMVPKRASAPHISLVGRNAGGHNPGDVFIFLLGGKDVRRTSAGKSTPYTILRISIDTDKKRMGKERMIWNINLDKIIPDGFTEGVWHHLEIKWGYLKNRQGLSVKFDKYEILTENSFSGPIFSSNIHIGLASETRVNDEGEINFTGVFLSDKLPLKDLQ
jgi:hypothetical protein